MDISDLANVYAIGYDLQDVKASFNNDLKVGVSEVSIDGKQGEILSIPRWVANLLESEKLVEIQDDDMLVSLKQSITKENIQGEDHVSTLEPDFYVKMASFMKRLSQQDHDKVESMLNTLIRKRQGKIVRLADSSKMTSDLAEKLSREERAFFNAIHSISVEFKKQIFGGKN